MKQAPGVSCIQHRSQTTSPFEFVTVNDGEKPGSSPNHTLHGVWDVLVIDDVMTTGCSGLKRSPAVVAEI